MLDEGNVRLNEPWLRFVVPQSRARIERTDIIQRLLHRFDRPAKRFRNLFMLLASFFGIAAGSAIGAAGAGATAVAAMPAISAVTAACSHSEASTGDKSLSLIPCPNSVSAPMPSAAASFTTVSTTVASASGGAGGAVPRSSSSVAIRYPSSLKFP